MKKQREVTPLEMRIEPDGSAAIQFTNGGAFSAPPLPDGDWVLRKAKELTPLKQCGFSLTDHVKGTADENDIVRLGD